ncbi:STAS domain-containing protein [Aquirufa aurantiipilula]|uniref:Anti-anti-sigma factor n=1 Tax=Aquirufa aurantiipilula TaxID=2696561 RepID=A0ABT6BHK3_9BACT|nr:STAS domain-containing protein [Aquirufa aurantiipilula]MBZ1325447.1 STAS domain-containing protein [Aquirufa aurantiipilula]MDF5689763.1 anti-anti-sigma factor [Aquirufa aurantiipilula]
MSTSALFQLDQNESYALIDWKGENLVQSNYEELENVVRLLFKKEYTNMILNISKVTELDGYGVSAIRKGTKICSNESGLFVVVSKDEAVVERLDQAKIENLTIMNTVREGVDAIYLNDLENDFGDGDEEEENEFGGESADYGDDY